VADPIKLLLLAGIAGSLAWGGLEYQRDNRQLPPAVEVSSDPAPVSGIALEVFDMPPLADYAETIERPLFFEGRRAPAEAEDDTPEIGDAPAPTASLPNIRLSAIVIEDEQRSAVVEILGTDQHRRLEVGQSVSGWEVVEIDETSVTMRAGARRHRFELLQFAQPPDPALRPQRTVRPVRPSRRPPPRPPGLPPQPR